MSYSMYRADRNTHVKVVAVGVLCAIVFVLVGYTARLGDLTRYLTYHEFHGDRRAARENYAALTDAERDWKGADLEAARAACPSGLDFAGLMPKVDDLLA